MKKTFYLSGLLSFCFLFCSVALRAAVPTISTNPHDTAVCPGITATFNVAAAGTATLTYVWQASTNGGVTWFSLTEAAPYSNTATDTLNIATDPTLSGNWYRVIVSNTSGSDTSTHGVLTIKPLPNAGTIIGTQTGVCVASSIYLSDVTTGGVWSSANTATATVNGTGKVTGVAQGLGLISYTYTNSCGSAQTMYAIHVDAPATVQPVTGPSATCVGASITLANANTAGTGTWSASNTDAAVSSAGVVTGIAGGNTTITYTFTNACNTVTATANAQVDVLLNHGTISGPTSVCTGSLISLSETVSGGIWLSSATGVANVDAAGNVTGVSQGSTTISYYLSNACGASVATYMVNVSRPASMIAGGDSVGIGAQLPLIDSVLGGTWSSASTSVATINASTGVVTGVSSGTSIISYMVTDVCGTSYATLTLNVGPAPSAGTISGADSVCINGNITLSDNVSGGVWTASNGKLSINSAGLVTGATSGLDTVFYTVNNAFGTTTIQKIIFVNSTPVLSVTGPNLVALGGNYLFYGTPIGGTYSTNNTAVGVFVAFYTDPVTRSTVGSFVVTGYGVETVHYSYTNSCGTTDSTFVIDFPAPAGVSSAISASTQLIVYPNPNQGEFTLNLASANSENAVVVITNVLGEKVKEFTMATNKPAGIILDQPTGLYLVSATTSTGKYSAKITITK